MVRPIPALPRHPAMTEPLVSGTAAPLSVRATASLTSAVVRAARQLLTDLERGRRIDAAVLRGAMEAAFGASDATGAWNWKIAYDACEVATVLFLRKFGSAIRARAGSPPAMLPMLTKIASLPPNPYPAFPGKRGASTILDADSPWSGGMHRGWHYFRRPRFGAFGGDRPARHFCGVSWRHRRVERVG